MKLTQKWKDFENNGPNIFYNFLYFLILTTEVDLRP
jgi:hypothetical protein